MLTVTEKAAEYIREVLTRKEQGAPEALRIVHAEEGYRLTLDDPKEGDQVFEREGQGYLVVDTEVGKALSDAKLDVQESPQGKSLTLTAGETAPSSAPQSEPPSEPPSETPSESPSEPSPKPEA